VIKIIFTNFLPITLDTFHLNDEVGIYCCLGSNSCLF